jgi:phenylacetate-CoA ligase
VNAGYGKLFRGVLQPLYQSGVRGRPTLSILAHLERTQWASRTALEAMQLAALQQLMQHAWDHVPFYRERMDAVGLQPFQIESLDHLRRLPLLTRSEAALSAGRRRSTVSPLPVIVKATSGSSGEPLAFAYDQGSEYWRQAIKLRGYAWAGCRPGDPTLHYWGAGQRPPVAKRMKIAIDRALRRETYVDCSVRGEAELRQVVRTIERVKPTAIVCYAQAGVDLARYVLAHGLRSWKDIRVICGAEPLFAGDRRALEGAFGPNIFETYGSREVMLLATETEAHAGMLVSMENLIVEILVTEPDGSTRPAQPGETGEVVVTDLHNFGMPFIRYVNGDLATAGPREKSPCGRAHQRIASVVGRTTDTIRGAAGERVSGMIFIVFFAAHGNVAKNFQVIQHANGAVTLLVVPGPTFTQGTIEELHAMAGKYLQGLPFDVETVEQIPPSPSGKRKVVVVEPQAS